MLIPATFGFGFSGSLSNCCRWKAVSLWILWEVVQCEGLSHETHTDTHRRKAVHLSVLWQTIYAAQRAHCAHDKAASTLGSAQRGTLDSRSWPKETMRYGLRTKRSIERDTHRERGREEGIETSRRRKGSRIRRIAKRQKQLKWKTFSKTKLNSGGTRERKKRNPSKKQNKKISNSSEEQDA